MHEQREEIRQQLRKKHSYYATHDIERLSMLFRLLNRLKNTEMEVLVSSDTEMEVLVSSDVSSDTTLHSSSQKQPPDHSTPKKQHMCVSHIQLKALPLVLR